MRAERYTLKVNPTFESAIGVPLVDVKLPRLKAWEEWNSPAIQALRLYQSQIENQEEWLARKRGMDDLMRRVASEYNVDVRAVDAAVNAGGDEDGDDDDEGLGDDGYGGGSDDGDDDDDMPPPPGGGGGGGPGGGRGGGGGGG